MSSSISFPLLSNIYIFQQKNGLKHRDYIRYRRACTLHLKKLRLICQRHNTKSKFILKDLDITLNDLNEHAIDFLNILTYQSERAWSYGMALKSDETDENPRKRYHYIKRFKKASRYVLLLQSLMTSVCDNRSQLEIEAYKGIIYGLSFYN